MAVTKPNISATVFLLMGSAGADTRERIQPAQADQPVTPVQPVRPNVRTPVGDDREQYEQWLSQELERGLQKVSISPPALPNAQVNFVAYP